MIKIIHIITTALLSVVLIFCFASCNNGQVKKSKVKENHYEELRNNALAMTPKQLRLSLPNDKTVVYGVVMDSEMSDFIFTTAYYQTGDASIYTSSGSSVVGGGQKESVNSATKKFMDKSQGFLNLTSKTNTTPLPDKDEVKFYFLTNNGMYVGQEKMENLEKRSSTWLDLFDEGNKVVTQLRLLTEQ